MIISDIPIQSEGLRETLENIEKTSDKSRRKLA